VLDKNQNSQIIESFFEEQTPGTCLGLTILLDFLGAPDKIKDNLYKHLARKIIGKNTNELRELFNVKNDFTQKEEEDFLKRDEWCSNLNKQD
jgi:hypothetical protein